MSKHADVAEHFIAQDKPKLTAGSMSFRGDRAFSWGTPVAKLLIDQGVVLIKPAGWHSWSTSTHCGWLHGGASKHKLRVFRVPAVDPIDHVKNLRHLNAELCKAFDGLERARSAHDGWKREIIRCQKDLADYRAIFDTEQLKEAA